MEPGYWLLESGNSHSNNSIGINCPSNGHKDLPSLKVSSITFYLLQIEIFFLFFFVFNNLKFNIIKYCLEILLFGKTNKMQ